MKVKWRLFSNLNNPSRAPTYICVCTLFLILLHQYAFEALTFLIKIGIKVVFDIVRCNVINGKLVVPHLHLKWKIMGANTFEVHSSQVSIQAYLLELQDVIELESMFTFLILSSRKFYSILDYGIHTIFSSSFLVSQKMKQKQPSNI